MDRILKERYKYTPLGRLTDPSQAGDGGLKPSLAEIETEAAACLCRKEAATASEIKDIVAKAQEQIGEDPLVIDNLDTADGQVQGVQIEIPADYTAEGILYIHFRYPETVGGKGHKYTLRNTVRVGRNSSVRIVVYHHGAASASTVVNSLTTIDTAAGASAEIIEVVETRAAYFGTALTSAHRDSHIKVTTVDLDNDYLRRNQFVTLNEPGAECDLEGVYITDGTQHCDNYIRMHHAVPHCNSNQLFKGVAEDESHAIFTGQIYVAKDAQKTIALQENHNIVLSDKAKIDTRPQLEIYADDVKCNHGATIGRLDPEAIYYMRQRGIGIEAAKRLQIEGFIDDIVDHAKIEDLQHLLRDKVAKRLQNI